MALTHQQYVAVDTQLQHLHQYLEALAAELCVAQSPLDKCGHTHQAAAKAVERIEELRYLLAVSEARRQVIEHRGESVPSPSVVPTQLLSWVFGKQATVEMDYAA
jgi:hypothetical protein